MPKVTFLTHLTRKKYSTENLQESFESGNIDTIDFFQPIPIASAHFCLFTGLELRPGSVANKTEFHRLEGIWASIISETTLLDVYIR